MFEGVTQNKWVPGVVYFDNDFILSGFYDTFLTAQFSFVCRAKLLWYIGTTEMSPSKENCYVRVDL